MFQYFVDLFVCIIYDFTYFFQVIRRHRPSAPGAQPGYAAHVMHEVVKFMVRLRKPAMLYMVPYAVNGNFLSLKKFSSFVGYGIDLFAVLFSGRNIPELFKVLKSGVDYSCARNV